MREFETFRGCRRTLLGAASVIAAACAANPALAESGPEGSEETPGIVIRDGFNPNTPPPGGILDAANVNGVGQVVRDAGGGSVGTCTGTLINPRTVIFAAHCVNTQAASSYGGNTGGTGVMVGFQNNTLAGIRQWLGLDGGTRYATNTATATYNVEQIWYDPRSLAPGSNGFLQADVAIATLDTPAFDIPTWAMLFTPLDGQGHVTVTGYGSTGTHSSVMASGTTASGGFRRRVAENYVSLLGSMADRNSVIFGSPSGGLNQNLYMVSFTDPNPAYNPSVGKFDFGIFGPNDVALPREGTTAPGDSGGPLILDQKYDRPVVLGVLSGGSRFFGAQPFSTYGTHSFYQPLYAFWDLIVANNPYVYATNKEGDGEWTDASHWVQAMDPNYMIDLNGQLINGVPDTPGIGIDAGGAKFGQVCFLTNCQTLTSNPAEGDGTPHFVEGGPGSVNFVPNNVSANPQQGIKSRYYDVTLAARGTTRLSNASVTIDRLTIDGPTSLDIASTGSLRALGEFNQYRGWTNIDGTLHTGEAFILSGLLSGSGTFRAPWLTTVAAAVAPGGADRVGTLTVDGNMIMASGSALFIEAGSAGADLLAVTGSLSLSDPGDASSGASLVFNKAPGAAPRHGQSFTIVTAGSGIEGRFGSVYSFQGVLRPELTYGENSITALLRAGSLVTILEGQDLTALAFASALDALRGTSYNSLYGLYGAIDLMDGRMLSATLAGLTPRITGETRILQDRQSRVMMGVVTDRLSMLGTDASAGLSIVGAPHALMAQSAQRASVQQGFAGLTPSAQQLGNMPKGVTGFVSGGVTAAPSSYGERVGVQSDQRNWHVGAGLETEVSDGLTVGTAFGYATGSSAPGLDRTSSKMAQAALYGSYRLGDGFYVGGVAAVERAEADQSRQASDGQSMLDLHGAAESVRYSAVAEAGVNIAAAPGVTLTPRLQLGYADYRIGGFRENGGELALQIDEVKLQRLEARMGARLAGATRIGDGWSLMPQIQADYVQLLSGSTDGMQVRFANAGDHAFGLPLAGGDASWGEVKGGVKLTKGKLEFGAGVETAVGRSAFRDDRAVADITFRF